MNKRGDINWFIVSIIISLLTLVLFIAIIVIFPFQQTIDRVACEESVVLKAVMPGDNLPLKDAINLRCKTRKICVTANRFGKGKCESLGEKFETQRITAIGKEEIETQIKMFISREMASCWEMMGEGKLEIFSRKWIWNTGAFTEGVICDRIEFDESVLNGSDKQAGTSDDLVSVYGLMEYMINHKVPNNNISYMDFLRNTPQGQSAQEYYGALLSPVCSENKTVCSTKYSFADLDLKKDFVIFYVETTRTRAGSLWGSTTLGVIGSFVGGSVGGFTGAKIVGGVTTAVGWFGGEIIQKYLGEKLPDGRNSVSGLFLTEYSIDGLKDYNIDSFENIY